jgi:hypothetical protein
VNTILELHQNMGEKVLQRLGSLVDIEEICKESGVIAGQSVASALSEVYGDGKAVVYNDVDVFRELQKKDMRSTRRMVLKTCNHETHTLESSYGQLVVASAHHYRVARTRREGLLNEVLCFGMKENVLRNEANVVQFLRSFDLNCVQVGIDTATRKLIWTPAFDKFHKTRQLLVENCKTPVHTAIRYFRKKNELDGVYGNDDHIMEVLAHMIKRLDNQNSVDFFNPESFGQFCFGKHYAQKLDDVQTDVAKWMDLKPVVLKGKDIELFTLFPRSDLGEDSEANKVDSYLLPTYYRAKQGYWKKNICAQMIRAITGTQIESQLIFTRGEVEFVNPVSQNSIQSLNKLVNEHNISRWICKLSIAQMLEFNEALKESSQKYGKCVYGILEHTYDTDVDLTGEVCFKDAVLRLIDLEYAKISNLVAPQKILPTMSASGGFIMSELTSAIELLEEGARQHHCVGGYAESVANGDYHIVSLRKERAKDSITVQLRESTFGWKSIQSRGVSNAEIRNQDLIAVKQVTVAMSLAHKLDFLGENLKKRAIELAINSPYAMKVLHKHFSYDGKRPLAKLRSNINNWAMTTNHQYQIQYKYEQNRSLKGDFKIAAKFLWISFLVNVGLLPLIERVANGHISGFDDMDDDIPF